MNDKIGKEQKKKKKEKKKTGKKKKDTSTGLDKVFELQAWIS
tara:strand:+ start:2936 stop:3061 length:126 start_codon:yes stop_codon:yes gene_type:complete